MPRLEHTGREAVEGIVVLAEQPGERHAVQPPGMAGARGMAVHVSVDPDQTERACAIAVQRARDARPGAAGAAVVAAQHAGQLAAAQRVGHGRGEQAA